MKKKWANPKIETGESALGENVVGQVLRYYTALLLVEANFLRYDEKRVSIQHR